jgi:hypothetical protein
MNATKELAKIIRTALSNGETILVTFKKSDGTKTCREITRNLLQIPKKKHPKFIRSESPKHITAFDIKKDGWIRFHEDSIIACANFSHTVEKFVMKP